MNATRYVIAGTDTDIGKTVFSAMLMLGLNADYWKPVQSGLTDEMGDTATVKKLTGLPDDRFIKEAYVLTQPLSPHRAAELDGVEIDASQIAPPPPDQRPLIIEAAGGLMVPLTQDLLQIDKMQEWQIPVILCCRTGLGTINHTLLSIEALNRRNIPIHGLAFIGDIYEDNIDIIYKYSGQKILGRLPRLDGLTSHALKQAFSDNFSLQDFSRAA